MNIVSFVKHVDLNFAKSTGSTLFRGQPGFNYVFGRAQLTRVASNPEFVSATLKQSLLDPRIANFVAKQGGSGNVLLYNGCGGFGDQIMTWPVSLILHNMGYSVHVLSDPGNAECWSNMPWVKSVNLLPMDLSIFDMFEHHAMFEVVSNMDEHSGQLHPVDAMLHKIGVDYKSIDPNLKSVRPRFSQDELLAADKVTEGHRIGIYQLSSASRTRSLTPDESVQLLFKLARSFPDITWLAVYDGIGHTRMFKEMFGDAPKNVIPYTCPSLRMLWAIIEKSAICVGPDSMIMHVAGSLSKPCVGLWGPTSPRSRALYYRNHKALYPQDACHMAPCNSYSTAFPKYCPSHNLSQCNVLSAISFDSVVDTIRGLITTF
jgi:ADP-heptose:LPS heptosyltransferase